ncbi:hypothetical protein [Endozoicomonas sp. Mp262]|uniref:hypothetical protein n=1 Tax=Endozoicomonas sp. Mp262 TaxID=2919499 RepID=UPI0021D8CFAC
MEDTPEDIALAVEIIRQLENLAYPEEAILQAMIYVCKDTLNKLPDQASKAHWRNKITLALADSSSPN